MRLWTSLNSLVHNTYYSHEHGQCHYYFVYLQQKSKINRIMEEIIELLKNPFNGLSDYESIKKKCEEIAQELFDNYGVKCCDKTFRFTEIEFYYYDREK